MTLEAWEALWRTNVTSTYLLCQLFGRPMIERGRGKIINFSSTDGFLGVPEQLAYNVSKGAIVQLTRTLGAEWIRHGVNVNAVAPCDFATPMIAPYLDTQEYRDWILDAIPAGRVGPPEEIVGAVLYLASPASDMVAGHNLLVDGGRTVSLTVAAPVHSTIAHGVRPRAEHFPASGPQGTVDHGSTCECGQRRDLRYGERWKCGGCRSQIRHAPRSPSTSTRRSGASRSATGCSRWRPGILLLTTVILFWVVGRAAFSLPVVAVAFLLASWAFFGRPFFRARKYRQALAKNTPTWTIKGDQPTAPLGSLRWSSRRSRRLRGAPARCAFAALSARTSRRSARVCATDSLTLWPNSRATRPGSFVPRMTIRSAPRSSATYLGDRLGRVPDRRARSPP